MFKITKSVLFLAAVIVMSFAGLSALTTIKANELLEKMDGKQPITIINALPADAYSDCHIKHANTNGVPDNIPYDTSKAEVGRKTQNLDKNETIYVYCASSTCTAGAQLIGTLKALGFKNIIDYKGGIEEWADLKYPVVGRCALNTKKSCHG